MTSLHDGVYLIPELRLAELLCTRLCHDLTGPIGALANGAEFLSDEGFDLQGQAVDLINSSATQAVARLQFYRKAYGKINEDGEADLSEQKKIAHDFFNGSKVMLDWPDMHTAASGVSVSYKMGRLLLNMLVLISATLLRGGTISVRLAEENGTREILVSANGSSIKWDKAIEAVLEGKTALENIEPKTVQAELTRQVALELNAKLTWAITDSTAELKLRKSA